MNNKLSVPEIEKSIIYCCLYDKTAYQESVESLSDIDFTTGYLKIFKIIQQLWFKDKIIEIDYNIVKARLSEGILIKLLDEVYDYKSANINKIDEYCKILKDKTKLRFIEKSSRQILDDIQMNDISVDEVITRMEEHIIDINKLNHLTNFISTKELLNGFNEILEIRAKNGGELISGLTLNIHDCDAKTLGIKPQDLVIIAGRPSMGKTELGIQLIVENTYKKNMPGAMFSLEENKNYTMERLAANICQIDGFKLRTGMLNDIEWKRYTDKCESIQNMPFYLDDVSAISVNELCAKTRRLKLQVPNLEFIVIDYLQKLSAVSTGRSHYNRDQEIGFISNSLKSLAKQLNIVVIAIGSLNRDCEKREDKRPCLSDLRESGNIESDADLVIFVYRDGYYKKDCLDPEESEIIIAKNRHGDTGTIKAKNIKNLQYFKDIERYGQE